MVYIEKIAVDMRVLSLWRVRLSVAALIAAALAVWVFRHKLGVLAWLLFIFAAAYAYFCFFQMPFALKRYSVFISDNTLTLKRGLLTSKTVTLRLDKIQFFSMYRSPLERRWRLATLRLQLPGGVIWLQGISWDSALIKVLSGAAL